MSGCLPHLLNAITAYELRRAVIAEGAAHNKLVVSEASRFGDRTTHRNGSWIRGSGERARSGPTPACETVAGQRLSSD